VQYGATAEGREDAISKAQREIEDVREIMVSLIWIRWRAKAGVLTSRLDAEHRAGAGARGAH